MRAILIAAALLAVAPASPALAPAAQPPVAAATDAFERDRQAILAQAGQYRVHFDMRENVSFRADYDPLEEKLSGGSEIVRVVYDKGDPEIMDAKVTRELVARFKGTMTADGVSFALPYCQITLLRVPVTALIATNHPRSNTGVA